MPVTTLRAGIIVGHGGISWEMTRQLVEHLPAMITPRWVRTRTQPIAVADVVRYLVGVLEAPVEGSRAFDIGGTEVLEYVEMLRRVAAIEGRTMIVVPVPLLTPQLSSRWLSLVTDVDVQTGRSLVDSMSNEVVVRDDSIRELVPFEPMDYDDAVLQALGERAKARRRREAAGPRRGRAAPCRTGWSRRCRATTASPTRPSAAAGGSSPACPLAGAGLLGVSLSTRAGLAGVLRADARRGRHLGRGRLRLRARCTWAGCRPATRRCAGPSSRRSSPASAAFGGVLRLRARRPAGPACSSARSPRCCRTPTQGSTPLVLLTTLANGAAEEVFFRGALYAAIGEQHPVALSTAVYALATTADPQPGARARRDRHGDAVRRSAPRVRRHPGAGPHAPDLVDADAALPAAAVRPAPTPLGAPVRCPVPGRGVSTVRTRQVEAVLTWPVPDAGAYERLVAAGVDGVIADDLAALPPRAAERQDGG